MKKINKERIDILVSRMEKVGSRQKAKALILAGQIFIGSTKIDKAGTMVPIDSEIIIKGMDHSYVSRGGLKLEKALTSFNLNIEGKIGLDIGSSTGGFTDCLLQKGCSKVYSIDVGKNLLDYRIRTDERVKVIEGLNARYLEQCDIDEPVDIVVMDVSFISIRLIIPRLAELMKDDAIFIPLIKPQFEVGKEEVEKGGIIKDREKHIRVIDEIIQFCSELRFCARDIVASPILGQKGNKEYLILFVRNNERVGCINDEKIQQAVQLDVE